MKHSWILLFLSLSLSVVAGEWELSHRKIVLCGKPHAMQSFAAAELERHLELIGGKATGATGGLTFHVGIRPRNVGGAAKHESVCIIDKSDVYFFGDEGTRGRPHYGALFAVYNFLEKQCGVLWIYRGDMGIVAPARKTLELPDAWEYRFMPPWELTSVRYGHPTSGMGGNAFAPDALKISEEESASWHAENHIWELRMRLCTRHTFSYGHAFTKWWAKYGKDHPDYFGLNPYGKRGLEPKMASRCKLCLSNPAVVDQIIADWEAKGKPKYLNICPNDGTPGYCFCENCRKLDEPRPDEGFYAHKTDRYVYFWNRIAEAAVKKRPDITLIAYIYSYYRFPPRRETIAYPDNMLFGIVPCFKDDYMAMLRDWKAAGMKRFFIRPNYECYGGVLPRGLERYLYDNFQKSRTFGIMGADYDGSPQRRALNLEYYVIARMMAFPDMAFDDILQEYYGAYGAASPMVREYYERQRQRGERMFNETRNHIVSNKIDMLDDGGFGHYVIGDHTSADFEGDLAVLAKADGLELSPQERARFENLKIQTRHFLLTARFYEDARANRNREASGKALIDFRVAHRDDIKDSCGSFFGGFEKRFWGDVQAYQSLFVNKASRPVIPENGFRSSFDVPSLDGWDGLAGFDRITSETASFDKYSAQLKTATAAQPALSRKNVPVSPGATYALASDWKFASGEASAVVTVTAGSRQLLRQVIAPKGTCWQTEEASFTVPEGCTSVDMTISTGAASQASPVFVDYIRLNKAKREE